MNFRLTAFLFGAILLIGVVLLVLTLTDDKEVSTDALLEELVGVKADQIDAVEMEREDGSKITLARASKDRWDVEWDAPAAGDGRQSFKAKADATAINELVGALLKTKPTTHAELTTNPAVHGLQPPGMKVTLRQGAERAGTINFGNATSGAKAVAFVTTSARPSRPMAVARAMVDPLFRAQGGEGKAADLAKTAADFRVKSVFAADPRGAGEDVSFIGLTAKGKSLVLNKVGGAWKFVQPAGWGDADSTGDPAAASGTFTGVSRLLGALTSLQAAGPADFVENPTPQQLAEYGLNPGNPDAVKAELKNKDGEVTIAYIGKKDAAAPAPPASPGLPGSGKVWVRVEGQPGVIRATAGDLAGLTAAVENPDSLRDRTLLATDKSRIDGIDVTVGGQTTKVRRAGAVPEWKLYGNPAAGDPQTAGPGVARMLDPLTERRTVKSFPLPNPANFLPGEVKAEVKVWADGFEAAADPKAEPKEKGQPTVLVFGRKDGDSIHVRRTLPDGAAAEFLLPEKVKVGFSPDPVDLLGAVAKTRLDLLDTSLRTFAPDAVTKIAVSGMSNYDLEKDEKKDPSSGGEKWTFAAPADQKGKTADAGAVAEMLRILGTQQSVTRVIEETPTGEKLAGYGLGGPAMPKPGDPPAPRLKVAIGLTGGDPADKERVYEFGVPTGDGNSVYARQAGKAVVFTVPKLVYDRFAATDLRDKAIFRFDPAAVTGVEFKGWGKQGAVVELNFEKNKDAAWTVAKSTIGNYNLDPNKLNAFLTTLSKTSVKAFLPGPPTPEQGTGNDKEYLIVSVKTASGPIFALNLGAPTDNGNSYFGWMSVLPQTAPMFTVDSAPFKVYKDGSGAFAK